MNVTKRESNIELLRVICMVLIIAHHCSVHGGGGANMEICFNKWFAIFLLPGGKICFDTFLAISMWFLVDSQFKTERFAKIWLETLFYSVTFAYVAYLFGVEFTGKDIFSVFLPITGNVHGYAAAYLILYALTPFLGIVGKQINKKQLQLLLITLLLANVFSLVVGNYTGHLQKIYSNVGFWMVCYFLSLYLKKYQPPFIFNQALLIVVSACCWLLIVAEYVGKAHAIDPTADIAFGTIPYYPNQVMHLEADITNLKEDTGFIPHYSFEDGIRETIEWYKKRRLGDKL